MYSCNCYLGGIHMNIQENNLFVTKTVFNPELLYDGVAVRIVGRVGDGTFTAGNYIVIENTGNTLTLVGCRDSREHLLKIDIEDIESGCLCIKLIAGVSDLKYYYDCKR